MRTIADEYAGSDIEMFDGVRVSANGGWFLVLPDASDPSVNVYAEGSSSDDADRLIDDVSRHIEQLVTA
jgi:mannose-1-phosphate guanylyltransferase/phosphomannomutase